MAEENLCRYKQRKDRQQSVRNADGHAFILGILEKQRGDYKVFILVTVGDGFQIFRVSPVGDADTGDLALLCHIYRLLFFHNGIIRQLIPSDPAAFLYKACNALGVGICLWDLIQCLFRKFLLEIAPYRSLLFSLVFTYTKRAERQVYNRPSFCYNLKIEDYPEIRNRGKLNE